MRAVVQRVKSAAVEVGGAIVARIGPGLLVFVGVTHDDGAEDVRYIAAKTLDLRIFPDAAGRMNRSVVESQGSVLVVSQFTLYADCRKGRRPSFDTAAQPEIAEAIYLDVVRTIGESGLTVASGVFQAHMDVALVNDGPVTMLLDSRRTF
jgi:D-tyrosyl-tRNA(Tyr) deacylase